MLAHFARSLRSSVRDPTRGARLLSSSNALSVATETKEKLTTGFVGLDVVPNAREVLIGLYGSTLKELQGIPSTAQYRINVEKITNYRLNVCNTIEDPHTIERTILQGQLEELISQAKNELGLIPQMKEWAPWDVPADHTIDYEIDQETYDAQMPPPPPPPEEPKK